MKKRVYSVRNHAPRFRVGSGRPARLVAVAALLSLVVTGCSLLPSAHRIDVQQGNIVDRAALAELRTGMSKKQVQFLLGNPILSNSLHPDRWDYIYYVTPAGMSPTPQRLRLYFEGDVLTRVLDEYFDGDEEFVTDGSEES